MSKFKSDFDKLNDGEKVAAGCLIVLLLPLLFAFGFAVKMGLAAIGIWAANTLAGHTVLALTWINVVAVAAVLWLLRFVFGGRK